MTSNPAWTPALTFDLRDVLERGALGGAAIGTAAERLEALLGPPEAPPARLGRKSRIWVSLYGNVSLLLTERTLSAIEIDFHGDRTEVVRAGDMGAWRRGEWEGFARADGWSVEPIADALKLEKQGFVVTLDQDGALQAVLVT